MSLKHQNVRSQARHLPTGQPQTAAGLLSGRRDSIPLPQDRADGRHLIWIERVHLGRIDWDADLAGPWVNAERGFQQMVLVFADFGVYSRVGVL